MTRLFTHGDLSAYLRRDLDLESADRAHDIALGAMRAEAGMQLILRATSTVDLPGGCAELWLPQIPVVVTDEYPLTLVGSTHGSYAPSEYRRVGNSVFRRDRRVWDETVTVTYTHGFDPIPPDLKAVALAVAARAYDNPQGLRSVSIDDYTETRAGTGGDLMSGVALMPSERRVLARLFGGRSGMVSAVR